VPSGGPGLPPKGRAETGYEYGVMFSRDLDRSYGRLKAQAHFYTLSLGISDRFCVDGKIGVGNVRVKGGIHLPKLEFNTGFAGGYGFRLKVFENTQTGTGITLGAQHVSIHPQDRSVDDDKYESFLDDWQISGLVSQKIRFLTAYAGIKVSDCEIVYNINKHDKKRRYSANHLGLVFGSDFHFFEDKIKLNIETRLFDETAFSTSLAYVF